MKRFTLALLLTLMASFPAFGETLFNRPGGPLAVDFAERMGIDTNNLKWKTVVGIPTEINGQRVPEELYTEKQLQTIRQAQELEQLMDEGEKAMRRLQAGEKPAPKIKDMRVVPSPPRSIEVDTSVY